MAQLWRPQAGCGTMETRTLGGWADQYTVGNEVGEMVTGVAQECLESEWLVLRVGI